MVVLNHPYFNLYSSEEKHSTFYRYQHFYGHSGTYSKLAPFPVLVLTPLVEDSEDMSEWRSLTYSKILQGS